MVFEGEVLRVTFESAGSSFRVIKVAVEGQRDPVAVIGHFPPVTAGARVRVRGVRESDSRHGDQVRALSLTELAPATLKGLQRYLASGAIKGVGPKTAERIVGRFGMDALRVLDDQPERLKEITGLGHRKAEQIATGWQEQRGAREVMVLLQGYGVSPALAHRIHKKYGAEATVVVSQQPYRLAMEVRGIGFLTADKIAQELGIARDAPERLQAGVLHALLELTDAGHVMTPHEPLLEKAAALLRHDERDGLEHALRALVMSGYVVREVMHDATVYFTRDMHTHELRLAGRLLELQAARHAELRGAAAAIARFEKQTGVILAPEQREAVELAARSPVLVVTGGPGVGKTTIVRALLALFDEGLVPVRLAAPTGRAAKRMHETTGREAQTIHRLLEIDPRRGVFQRDAARPVDAGTVIVDEASMVDLPLADALTQAIAPGTRLLLVGDVDQLPSVGPGAVLRDVIASGAVPVVRLRHIFRQARESLIVQNAHRINAGMAPLASRDADADFFVIERKDPDAARATVLELVKERIPRRFGLDPVRDVQVLTPMHRGDAGATALNESLQNALNPHGREVVRPPGARVFKVGDKVMQLRNNYDKEVYNGDVGFIVGTGGEEGRELVVRFDDRDVTFAPNEQSDLVLAYACTIHKAQGSEYPAVVVVMLSSHFVMLSKNLLYTAVTRAKRLLVLVSDARAVGLALKEERRNDRRSRLAERLAGTA